MFLWLGVIPAKGESRFKDKRGNTRSGSQGGVRVTGNAESPIQRTSNKATGAWTKQAHRTFGQNDVAIQNVAIGPHLIFCTVEMDAYCTVEQCAGE